MAFRVYTRKIGDIGCQFKFKLKPNRINKKK